MRGKGRRGKERCRKKRDRRMEGLRVGEFDEEGIKRSVERREG